jgi:transposase
MFSLNKSRVFVYKAPVTMLTSFDGLSGLISNHLKQDPLSGDAFVFINNRRTKLKILRWESNGFVMIYKRLEKGTFENPAAVIDDNYLPISHTRLVKIITGKRTKKPKI